MAARKIAAALVLVLLIIGSSFFYSYSQLTVEVGQVAVTGVEWSEPNLDEIEELGLALVSGDYIVIAMSLMHGIVVEGVLEVNNPSFLPVNIHEARSVLTINGVQAGLVVISQEMVVSAGSTGIFQLRHEVALLHAPSLVAAILATGGELDLVFEGHLETRPFTIPLSLDFSETENLSLEEEIENQARSLITRVVGGLNMPEREGGLS